MKYVFAVFAIALIMLSGCTTTQQQNQIQQQTPAIEQPSTGDQTPAEQAPPVTYPMDKTFDTLAKQPSSGYLEAKDVVITNQDDLKAAWEQAYSKSTGTVQEQLSQVPTVDFTQDMVIAVFMGKKPTGGYATEITSITETETTIEVKVVDTTRKTGDPVVLVQTAPFHIVKTAKSDKPVVFIR